VYRTNFKLSTVRTVKQA